MVKRTLSKLPALVSVYQSVFPLRFPASVMTGFSMQHTVTTSIQMPDDTIVEVDLLIDCTYEINPTDKPVAHADEDTGWYIHDVTLVK